MDEERKTYNSNIELWRKAYSEILEVCEKYPNFSIFGFYDINEFRNRAKNHLLLIEWYEKYGLKLSHDCNPVNYIHLGNYSDMMVFNDAELCKEECRGRSISWPDDGRQPEDGWYYHLGFSTGAYIFGDDYDYQKELFQKFITELKTYNPDYCDTVNHDFYWKIENCKKIFDDFNSILQKYHNINKSELQERKVKKLKVELEKEEAKLNP